jgi:hypothetical protein
MNKKLMIVFLVIAFIGIGLSGEILGGALATARDVELTYPSDKYEGGLTKTEMIDFNDVKYEVKGNQIILNKTGVFQNKVITFNTEQSCLEWIPQTCTNYIAPQCEIYEAIVRPEAECIKWEKPFEEVSDREVNNCIEWKIPEGCKEFDSKIGECLAWEKEAQCLEWSVEQCLEMSQVSCKTWTNYKKEDFISQAIKEEIDFVKKQQIIRTNTVPKDVNENGKVVIK